jgi:uncharacterized membrane protein
MKDRHYAIMSSLCLIVALLQILYSVQISSDSSYYYLCRMAYPICQLIFLVVCLVFSTRAAKVIDEDIIAKTEGDEQLCYQGQILLFKIQGVFQ